MTNGLELRDIHKSFGDCRAVAGVDMTVPRGAVFGLLGPNGAGKTTTIRMIMDIIAPDRGEILLHGQPRRREDLHRVGYLPEERGLYRKMKVLDHLVFLGELHGLRRSEGRERGEEWLRRLELAEWSGRKVEELSKGMQQKIQIAGTLLHDPELVILDEPFSGLDPINQELFREVLAGYKEEGKTILFSTHVMEQAEKLCDHICLISRGRAVLAGNLREIKRRLGGNSYRVVVDGDAKGLEGVEGVEQVVDRDSYSKLLLAEDADGPAVLRRLVDRCSVREFRSEEPDLAEIFVKAVRDAA